MSHKGKGNTNYKLKGQNLFKGDIPKAPVEEVTLENGTILKRKADHMRNGNVYHPTKGFRKVWKQSQHYLLTSLMLQYGVSPL